MSNSSLKLWYKWYKTSQPTLHKKAQENLSYGNDAASILITGNTYTVILKFGLINLGLELQLRVRVFADVYYNISYYYYTVQLYWNRLLA